MSRFEQCAERVLKSVPKASRDELRAIMDEVYKDAIANNLSDADAILHASRKAGEVAIDRYSRRVTTAISDAQKVAGIWSWYQNQKKVTGEEMGDAIMRVLFDNADGRSGISSLEADARGVRKKYDSTFVAMIRAVGDVKFGFWNDMTKAKDFVMALHGKSVDDPKIMHAAQKWRELATTMRDDVTRLGADLGKIVEGFIPQAHSVDLMLGHGTASKGRWVKFIRPLLIRSRYVNGNGAQMTDAELDEFLGHAFDTLVTSGASKLDQAKGMLGRLSGSRELHFDGGEKWSIYHAEYGGSSMYEMMDAHIKKMSAAVAVLNKLGTKPEATVTALFQMEAAERSGGRIADFKHTKNSRFARDAIAVLMGRTNQHDILTSAYDRGSADWFAQKAARAVMASNQMVNFLITGATAVALDMPTMLLNAKFFGISMGEQFITAMKMYSPGKSEERLILENAGYQADDFVRGALRFGDDIGASRTIRHLSAAHMTVNFMSFFTARNRMAAGMVFQNTLGRLLAKSIDDLHGADRRFVDQFGITNDEWASLRQVKPTTVGTLGTVISIDGIRALNALDVGAKEALIHKVLAMTAGFQNTSVVTPGLKLQTWKFQNIKRGSPLGLITESAMALTSFPLSYSSKWLVQRMRAYSGADKLYFGAALFGMMTTAGMLQVQMQALLGGNTPRNMNPYTPEGRSTWGKAVMVGGPLGIFSNIMEIGQARHQPKMAAFGPTGEHLSDAHSFGGYLSHTDGEGRWEPKIDKAFEVFTKTARDYTPFVNAFWLKGVFNRLVFDNLQEMVNPGYKERMREKLRERTGQEPLFAEEN